jgi:hypothetical protein
MSPGTDDSPSPLAEPRRPVQVPATRSIPVNIWSRSRLNQAVLDGTPVTSQTNCDLRKCWSERCTSLPLQGTAQDASAPQRLATMLAPLTLASGVQDHCRNHKRRVQD